MPTAWRASTRDCNTLVSKLIWTSRNRDPFFVVAASKRKVSGIFLSTNRNASSLLKSLWGSGNAIRRLQVASLLETSTCFVLPIITDLVGSIIFMISRGVPPPEMQPVAILTNPSRMAELQKMFEHAVMDAHVGPSPVNPTQGFRYAASLIGPSRPRLSRSLADQPSAPSWEPVGAR